eukprot:c22584_g1_i1 orf=134-1768(-)
MALEWSGSKNDLAHPSDSSSFAAGPGTDFASGIISFGDIAIAQVTSFEEVWSTSEGGIGNKGLTFYKPVNLPEGFSSLGFLSQPYQGSSEGRILVAKTTAWARTLALASPIGYTLVWSSTEAKGNFSGPGFFWKPTPLDGYASLGYVVTTTADEPGTEDVMCVRIDLTDSCKVSNLAWETHTPSSFKVWNHSPCEIEAESMRVPVGAFFCSVGSNTNSIVSIACLKNNFFSLSGMPSLGQLHSLIRTYGPTFYFHPDEEYFPASVSWFFGKNVWLHAKGESAPVLISADGSNLPEGGMDDDQYWIDLPNDATADEIRFGNLSTAKVYIHAKPMLGATCTDIAMWMYYPFNGAATAKFEVVDLKLGKIGEHVSDWEHVTLRVNNVTGKLWKVFFSQHSGGIWLDAANLEYVAGTKFSVYSSKAGHASYPHPGLVLQGDHGVGIRNDTAKSKYLLDSSQDYQIVSADYLGDENAPEEPLWLQYMRKWGPKVQYDSKHELDKAIKKAPFFLRSKLRSLANRLPDEVFGEEGPTGPKQKSSWNGDEKV